MVCRALGCETDDVIACDQVHGTRIAAVDETSAGRGAIDYATAVPATDGLIACSPGIMLSLYFADCAPVLLLDPVTPAIGLAHAGWKGTAGRIAVLAVEAMSEKFGTAPDECLAAVGPSIGSCCYEVGDDVVQATAASVVGGDDFAARSGDRYMLDLPGIVASQLVEAGIPPRSIVVPGVCTRCCAEDFFSYRREGPTGRMGAFLMLVPGLGR